MNTNPRQSLMVVEVLRMLFEPDRPVGLGWLLDGGAIPLAGAGNAKSDAAILKRGLVRKRPRCDAAV